jgi:protein-S-isoprenylcysteine O-methyltransferase Ste14
VRRLVCLHILGLLGWHACVTLTSIALATRMLGVGLVLAGFVMGLVHDLVSYWRVPRIKPLLLLIIGVFHASGAYLLIAKSSHVAIPQPIERVASVVAILGFLGMLYSIGVEIPLRRAWINRGHLDELVTSGTYSISRHPGVLWAAVWIPSAAVGAGSRDLLLWWPVLLAADILHVWIQDRFFLPRAFGGAYHAYQREVPFLISVPGVFRRVAGS